MGKRALVILFVCSLAPAQSLAQAEDPAYRAIIADAVEEFDASRYAEARALFRQAHALSPNARTLRGIGLCSFEMSDYAEAYVALSQALTDQRRPLTSEQRQQVEGVLARATTFIGFFRVRLVPEAATLIVDGGEPILASDGRIVLALGDHQLVARVHGHPEARSFLRVEGGEDREIELAVYGEESAERIAPPEGAPPPSAAADPTPAIVLLALGGAATLAAATAGPGWWIHQQQELDLCSSTPGCLNESDLASERDAAIGTTIALAVVGIAGIIGGAVMLATAGSGPRAAAACAPAGGSLRCRF
jgi:hypothetical protein